MKIGCCYHPREHVGCGKFHFIAAALRAIGHETYHVQTMDDLKRADQACDFVLHEQRGPASLCLADFREFLPHRKAIHLQWYFDLNVFDDTLPLEKQPAIEPFLEIMRGMDVVFVKERDRLLDYRDIGVNAVWLDQGCPSAMRQAELRDAPEYDVILWGSTSRPMWRQRWEDVESLVREGFEVAWATNDGVIPAGCIRLPGCQPMEIPSLVEKARVTLVVDARNDIQGYWSDRIWLAAGAGACIVRRTGISGGQLPGIGYFTTNSMLSTVDGMCGSFEQRLKAGKLNRSLTMTANTYEHRAQEVVNHAQRLIQQRHEESALPGLSGDQNSHSQVEVRGSAETALSGL